MPEILTGTRPFQEAVDYFRNKVNLPTKTYRDIQHGAHTKAFVVAGATKEDLLADFRAAIDKAISQGTTLEEFQKDFDDIVKKSGWSYNGSRGWRSKTIYTTNIKTAYAAGRYKQMTDPDVLKRRPYWQYLVGDSKNHRKEHLELNGLILRADDPFWEIHFPPNGWGCKCRVRSLSENDLKRMGRTPDKAPQGISDVSPDWRYNIGEAAYGNPFVERILKEDGKPRYEWKDVTAEKSAAYDQKKDDIPEIVTQTRQIEKSDTAKECQAVLEKILGGKKRREYQRQDPTGAFVSIIPETLAKHVFDSKHTKDVPFIPELIENPSEIWAFFDKEKSGKYRIKKRYIAHLKEDKNRFRLLVAEGEKGVFKAITNFIRGDINKARNGICIYSKEKKEA